MREFEWEDFFSNTAFGGWYCSICGKEKRHMIEDNLPATYRGSDSVIHLVDDHKLMKFNALGIIRQRVIR
jgi:hypothetical protein